MLKTLERYQKCNYGAPEANVSTREALVMVNSPIYIVFKCIFCPFNFPNLMADFLPHPFLFLFYLQRIGAPATFYYKSIIILNVGYNCFILHLALPTYGVCRG